MITFHIVGLHRDDCEYVSEMAVVNQVDRDTVHHNESEHNMILVVTGQRDWVENVRLSI